MARYNVTMTRTVTLFVAEAETAADAAHACHELLAGVGEHKDNVTVYTDLGWHTLEVMLVPNAAQ